MEKEEETRRRGKRTHQLKGIFLEIRLLVKFYTFQILFLNHFMKGTPKTTLKCLTLCISIISKNTMAIQILIEVNIVLTILLHFRCWTRHLVGYPCD